jgi:endonuclease/exonuclease/phosphatase family metal-dependent hydrolase
MYRKTVFLLYLTLVLTLSQLVCAQTTIKVMTFNIWGGGGDNLNKCTQAIQSSGADIIGIQEASGTLSTIAGSLGFYYDEGTSTLSRYPITAVQGWGYGQAVTVSLPSGKDVYVFNCHLTAYPYGPYELPDVGAALQAELQTQWAGLQPILLNMSSYIATGKPCFLTGDFNVSSHLDYANVPWKCSQECARAGLVDSYRSVHPGNRTYPPSFDFNEPGITWTPKPAQEPYDVFDRIDLVYSCGNNVVCTASEELDSRNSVTPWPSDHRAVVSTFSLVEPNATPQAANPAPPDGVGYMDVNVDLSWAAGVNAVSHNIYFGTDSTPDAGEFQTNKTDPNFDPGTLQYATEYYWRIDEVNGSNTVTGDVWSFTTQCIAGAVTGDLTDDCIVDDWDLRVMSRDWLLTDSNISAVPVNSPPIGWWRLDEGAGAAAADSSVNNNNGSLVSSNPSAMWVSGHTSDVGDYALHFNGTSEYVLCAERTGSGPGTYPAELMPSDFTVSCWAKLDSFVYFSAFVGNGIDTGADECGFFLYNYGWQGDNGQDFGLAIRTESAMHYVETPNIYSTGTWYHLAATYDGQYTSIYIDGFVAAGPTDVGGPIRWISADSGNYPERFTIGVWKDPGYELFVDGITDEVRFYNYALSELEILTLAEIGSTYKPLDSPANLMEKVPPGGPYDPNNPDIVNFSDYEIMADYWLYGTSM